MRRFGIAFGLLLGGVACDDTVFGSGGGGGGGGGEPATWEGVQAYLDESCGSCHPGAHPLAFPEGIEEDITSGTHAYVVPGDPDNSYLWQVLIATPESEEAVPMPLGRRDPLDPVSIQHIRLWIYDGAPLD